MAVLQRYIQVGQHQASCHQRNHLVHTRVGVHIVQAHPGTVGLGQLAQGLDQFEHARLDGLAVVKTGAVFDVHAVGRGVLTDHQQFLDAAFKQGTGLTQHVADRARHQVAAHRRDDAESAAVVAAFADLEVGVMPRRELDAGDAKRIGHQIDKGVVRLGQVQVHRVHDFLGGVRARDGEHAGVHLFDQVAAAVAGLGAQATGDDDLAVGRQRFADGVQAFAHGVVNEAAGVDDDQVSALESLGGFVTLGAQAGQDQFGIGQRLRAAQADKTDARRGFAGKRSRWGGRCRGGAGVFTHGCIVSEATLARDKRFFVQGAFSGG